MPALWCKYQKKINSIMCGSEKSSENRVKKVGLRKKGSNKVTKIGILLFLFNLLLKWLHDKIGMINFLIFVGNRVSK